MSDRQKKIVIIGTVLILVMGGVLAYLQLRPKPAAPAPAVREESPSAVLPTNATLPAANTSEPQPTAPRTVIELPVTAPPPAPADPKEEPRRLAGTFAERYGSYSNQGDFQNLKDLLPLMTPAFRTRTEAMIAGSATSTAEYEGVTSQFISSTIESFSETNGTASVRVTLQQYKTSASNPSVTSYADLVVRLVKSGTAWFVDAVRTEVRPN